MIDAMGDEDIYTKPLGRRSVFYYGVGHMLNDITSACWFTYLLVFLTDIGLSPRDAAAVMLSGQIADGFTTVFAGELIDRFGHFKIWHGAGSILVAVSFSSVFGGCLPCKLLGTNSSAVQTAGYIMFAAIFNVGWAATQVSHMSMVNCITLNSTSRVVLASCRNAFTMVANLSLYAVAFTVFNVMKPSTLVDIENQYRWIAYLSIFVGCCFVGIFHIGTKEPRHFLHSMSLMICKWPNHLKLWFLLSSTFAASLFHHSTGDQMDWPSHEGCLFCWRHSLDILWRRDPVFNKKDECFYVTAISMQSVLVGEELNGCAFVYGSLSFLDKVSCGLALYILESYQSSSPNIKGCHSVMGCLTITRYGLGLIPAISALFGVAVTYTMILHNPASKPLMEPLLV